MRWERLFADLEAQLDASAAAELAGEIVERTRIEVGALRLVDRLRATVGHPVRLRCLTAETVAGTLQRVGPDWLLVGEPSNRDAVVSLAAITGVVGLGALSAVEDAGVVAARLDLRYALRCIARDRAGVRITQGDGSAVLGTIDRVGADFVEVAEHPPGEPRRAGAVRQVQTIPIAAIVVVRTS